MATTKSFAVIYTNDDNDTDQVYTVNVKTAAQAVDCMYIEIPSAKFVDVYLKMNDVYNHYNIRNHQ